jgi:hypothetical protein
MFAIFWCEVDERQRKATMRPSPKATGCVENTSGSVPVANRIELAGSNVGSP